MSSNINKSDKCLTPSLARAYEVLKMIVESKESVSASAVARQWAIPRTTALRILHTLCREGLLACEGHRYRAGGDLFRLRLQALDSTHAG